MGIELLGPLLVDGKDVSLQRRDHVVLAVLAIRAGEAMQADGFAEALWGDAPPPSWHKIVHGCVLRLRRSLGTHLIETTRAGYRLSVSGDGLDTQRFDELVQRGRAFLSTREPDRAVVLFARALDLWRGSPFSVLDSWSPGRVESARFEELRRTAEEGLLEARLASGEHSDVVSVAEARVAEEPLREHRWALLALALYRCGRQADALRAVKRARNALVEQLGIEPGAELVSLETAILRQDATLLAPAELPTLAELCPYQGLAPYDVTDSDAFFGRDSEIDACIDRLGASPLLVVTGPSGCGKSSLARAGLVPALRRAGHETMIFQPGSDADAAMANALATCESMPVLVVDQFEELFAFNDESVVRAGKFCARLAKYATDTAPVVITVRADHVAALAADVAFARLAERGMHLVTPLAGDALRRAIEGPAGRAGLRLEPGLVDLLVRECDGEPGALPLLSHALAETWHHRDGRVLTVEGYRATGEIRGAVARSADRLYESLPAGQRPRLRSILLRLVSPSEDGEPVFSRVATKKLGGDADRERVLGLLVGARLITAKKDTVELAHEALARAWPRLRSWLDEDAAGQRILRHLSAAADGWESLGRPATELYRGARLQTALEWNAATSPDLTDQEAAFLEASANEATSERRLHADRTRAQARQKRRFRRALAGVVVLLVAATAGGVASYQQRKATDREHRGAAVAALAGTSEALRSSERDLAALLAVEAYELAPNAASESALFGTLTAANGLERIVHTDIDLDASTTTGFVDASTTTGVFVPDSETLALVDRLGGVHLINLSTGERTQLEALGNQASRAGLSVSSNGQYLTAFWSVNSEQPSSLLTVWDLRTGERRFDPTRVPYRIWSVAINEDGSLIASSGGNEHRTQIRSGATGALQLELEPLPQPSDTVSVTIRASVAFAPDGRLVVGSETGPIRFIDPTTGAELQRIDGPPLTSETALFLSRDGTALITAGQRGVMSFDVESGESASENPTSRSLCPDLAYAELIGATLCADGSGLIAHDLAAGDAFDPGLDVQQGDVCGLVVSGDGTRLAAVSSCSSGATITEWRLDGGGPVSRLAYRTSGAHAVQGYGFAGDSSSLVVWEQTGSEDATLAIDTSTGDVIDEFPDEYGIVATDDPNVVYALFGGDNSVAQYDILRHASVARIDVGLVADWMSPLGDRIAVGSGSGVRVVDFAVDPPVLGSVIDGDGQFDIVDLELQPEGLLLAVSIGDGDQFQIERRDPFTGELLGEPAVGYRTVTTGGGVAVFRTTDGRILEVDPGTLQPIGLSFGDVAPDDWMLIDGQGRHLAVLGDDMSLRLYDLAARRQLGDAIDLGDLELGRAGAAFRSDGLEMAVDTEPGIVIWDLDPAHWVEAACQLAGRNLTHAEWDQYVGDLAPYHQTCPAYPAG